MFSLVIFLTFSSCNFRASGDFIADVGNEKGAIIYIKQIAGPRKFQETVFQSLKNIEYQLHKPVFFHSGNFPITIRQSFIIQDENEDGYETSGFANIEKNNCEIVINTKTHLSASNFQLILYHEIGHCLGLEHPIKDNGSIMDAKISDETENSEFGDLPSFLSVVNSLTERYMNCEIKRIFYIDPVLVFMDPTRICPNKRLRVL